MTNTKKCAVAMIYGPLLHHLDHLGPLSQMLGISLFVTDEDVASQARLHYPRIDLKHINPQEIATYIAEDYDIVFSCLPRAAIEEIFFFPTIVSGKRITSVWCPHGNSDKGYTNHAMGGLRDEHFLLVYGKKMLDFIVATCPPSEGRLCVDVGNFRLEDYRLHKAFYDQHAERIISRRLPLGRRNVLFAPTWEDSEGSGSFFDIYPLLIDTLPSDTNLLIKLHPNTLRRYAMQIEAIEERYSANDHIVFLNHYPHIYSLLSLCDAYIGDMSSIGYDFLIFNRPMVFLNRNKHNPLTDPRLYLHRCGIHLRPEEYPRIYEVLAESAPFDHSLFGEIRHEVFEYTFGVRKHLDDLRKQVEIIYTLSQVQWRPDPGKSLN